MSEKRAEPSAPQEVPESQYPAMIEKGVQNAIRAVGLLIDHGNEAVVEQVRVEMKGNLVGMPNYLKEGRGVCLFSSIIPRVALPALEEIYARLGVTQIRLAAVPTKEEVFGEISYTLPIGEGGITLIEEQSIAPGEEQAYLYQLFGHAGDLSSQ